MPQRDWKRALYIAHSGGVRKVFCAACYRQRVQELANPGSLLHDLYSDPTAPGWIPLRSDALSRHLRHCVHQPQDVRERRADAEHEASLQRRRERNRRRRIAAAQPSMVQADVEYRPNIGSGTGTATSAGTVAGVGMESGSLAHGSMLNPNIIPQAQDTTTTTLANGVVPAISEGGIIAPVLGVYSNILGLPFPGYTSEASQILMFPPFLYGFSGMWPSDATQSSYSLAGASTSMTAETLLSSDPVVSWPETTTVNGIDQYTLDPSIGFPQPPLSKPSEDQDA